MNTSTITAKVYTESGLAAACHVWFHNTHPALRGLGFMIHNDGQKNQIQAAQDTARGVVRGIPDWCLAVPRGGYHHLYVELKVNGNQLSPLQRKRHEQLRAQGHRVEVVRELAAFQTLLTDYLTA